MGVRAVGFGWAERERRMPFFGLPSSLLELVRLIGSGFNGLRSRRFAFGFGVSSSDCSGLVFGSKVPVGGGEDRSSRPSIGSGESDNSLDEIDWTDRLALGVAIESWASELLSEARALSLLWTAFNALNLPLLLAVWAFRVGLLPSAPLVSLSVSGGWARLILPLPWTVGETDDRGRLPLLFVLLLLPSLVPRLVLPDRLKTGELRGECRTGDDE